MGISTPKKSSPIGVHFIGIGGIGMSGLARYFLALSKYSGKGAKWVVSGSDAVSSTMTQELIKEGVKVKIGHKKGNIPPNTRLVIYNRAIAKDNPELAAAKGNNNLVAMPYAKALGRITENYQTIAITGSHGKSTTTALAGLALVRGGLDPTILVGTKLADLKGKNLRVGRSRYLVLEADDFGGAFMEYSPTISIVTNIDKEHMDFYKNFANVKRAFIKFLGKTRPGGVLILNKDDAPLYSLKPQITRLAKKKDQKIAWYSVRSMAKEAKKIRRAIAIPGEHNVSNALAVIQLGKLLAVPEKKILESLASYRGAWRRMEYKGTLSGGTPAAVYDDYAHHPTEIKATLAAFKGRFPNTPLVCVFQPHQAKRLELLFSEFTCAFDMADIIIILPLYKVLGRDEKLPHDSQALVRAIKKRLPKKQLYYVEEPKKLKTIIGLALKDAPTKKPSQSPVLVMMGAGDIADLTEKLLK
jgi:UDP-N-acetylmuramate--alanine ligase